MKKILMILFMLIYISTPALAVEKIGIWKEMPITVYIEDSRRTYLMKKAFSDWESASNKLVEFEYVDNPQNAQIVVTFADKVSDVAERAVGLTYPSVGKDGYFRSAKIIIAKYSDTQTIKMTNHQLMKIMRHEIGHAIGLGHSTSPNSIMNATTNRCLDISKDDLKDLKEIYNTK